MYNDLVLFVVLFLSPAIVLLVHYSNEEDNNV